MNHGTIRIGPDNKVVAVKGHAEGQDPLAGDVPSRDSVVMIQEKLKTLPTQCKFFWILGHADEKQAQKHMNNPQIVFEMRGPKHMEDFLIITKPLEERISD